MDTPHFFPINRCPVSVITFWIKEAQSGGIEGNTPTLERALGVRQNGILGPLGGSLGHRGGPPFHNTLWGSLSSVRCTVDLSDERTKFTKPLSAV